MGTAVQSGSGRQLLLGTVAFALCFAVFGSVSAMMPIIRKQLSLNPIQASVAIAIPVLLGSIGRIPLGILADRYGGRVIFSILVGCSGLPAVFFGWGCACWRLVSFWVFIGVWVAWVFLWVVSFVRGFVAG